MLRKNESGDMVRGAGNRDQPLRSRKRQAAIVGARVSPEAQSRKEKIYRKETFEASAGGCATYPATDQHAKDVHNERARMGSLSDIGGDLGL